MKSYTDIEQSKKLAKILPLESADMFLALNGTLPVMSKYIDNGLVTADDTAIPCWSLAALLEEMPEIINFDGDKSVYALEILKEGGLYYLSYGNLLGRSRIELEPQECFVDACYEMILRLHEQNLL